MRFNDAIFGAALILFAVAEIAYTRTFPSLHGQAYGPDLFPVLIGIGLAACGVSLIVRGVVARRAEAWIVLGDWARDRRAVVDVALVLLSLVVYIVASDRVGFIPLSVAILTLLLYRLGSSPLAALAIAIATTLVIQVLFARVLLVPLPGGLLQPVLW